MGRVNGKVCFVPHTAVGDLARIRVVREKKSYLEGILLECVEPSSSRTIPPCEVFGDCGGCCWQHLPYDLQVRTKHQIFSETLQRGASVNEASLLPIIPAPSPFGYRSRVQFKVRSIGGKIHMGFYRPGSHFIVDTPGVCLLASERINRIFAALQPLLKGFPDPERLPQIDISVGDTSGALLLFHYIGEREEEVASWLDVSIPAKVPVTGVFLQSGRKTTLRRMWGEERVWYSLPADLVPGLPETTLSFRCGSFSQVNYRQNLALIETVLRWAELSGKERILDLFCGNGNFSLAAARFSSEVVGFEAFEQSIADAENNAKKNGITNASFFCADSGRGLRELISTGSRFDVVILDPPREGAPETVRLIPSLAPEKVIYVSCDPSTLARDLSVLGSQGYAVVSSRAVDMFPQTYHIESVTLLSRKP